MSGTAIIIFAKAPMAGLAKTRLIPALGAAGAAALAQRMLVHAVHVAAELAPDTLEVCAAPDATHPAFGRLARGHGLQLATQGAGDLGQRMHLAFVRMLVLHDRALMIGTDAPALDAACLRQAQGALEEHDAVFVPALDGGYALIGLRKPNASLFDNIAWSTSAVMAQTRERLRAGGLRWAELPAVADVDEPADLVHLPAGWLL
ncbi:MAG: TIGR04282 family arsenosugar biosynthesis glycosyltransferase [Ramlibacter sp.]|nr:TIGR04282 family arsenosugar biosynthesis glycosyltransferase [Ramlibacter sp.]